MKRTSRVVMTGSLLIAFALQVHAEPWHGVTFVKAVNGRVMKPSYLSVKPGKNARITITKVPVTDCRAVRGFIPTPVDGSVKSWDYRGKVIEYPDRASDGVVYGFNHNDGLHLRLKDTRGFDAVVLRGGAHTRMYAGETSLVEPSNRKPAFEFSGSMDTETAFFTRRVQAGVVSMYGIEKGHVSDVSFYRFDSGVQRGVLGEVWSLSNTPAEIPKPALKFAPESIFNALQERYPDGGRTLSLVPGDTGGSPVQVVAGGTVHFITAPFTEQKGLASISLDLTISSADGDMPFTVAVQDPLDPRLDLMWVPMHGEGAGEYHLDLDIPDQVLLPETRLWITLVFGKEVTLAGIDGGAPCCTLGFVPDKKALPEALERRKFLLKGFFFIMSEPRPWGAYRNQSREDFFASGPYAAQCPELFMTIDLCHALAPEDNIIRQYREWTYIRNLTELSPVSPPPVPPDGVPGWAWYPRQAWLEIRRIAAWWLDNRLVPTGEFGGAVGDDSDMYQQYADMPFFEDGGVGARLRASAALMAEYADRENLRGGINIHSTDALHAYEEGINHLALMARWFYGDPIYLERCMDSARNIEKLLVTMPDNRVLFRDYRTMGYRDVETPRTPALDGAQSPLMWHAALQAADFNHNPRALETMRKWADTWLTYMQPGKWATEVDVVSSKVLETSEQPLAGGYGSQACVFLWLAGLTGDKKYIEPFLYYLRNGEFQAPSNFFLGDMYAMGFLHEIAGKTLDSLAGGNAILRVFRTGDADLLVRAAIGSPQGRNAEISTLHDAARFPDMYTSAEQFTDRIFPSLIQYASYSYFGGSALRNKFNSTHAVSWSGFGTDYGALVTDNRKDRFTVLVYSYADVPMKGSMRVWNLEHGRYRLTVGPDADGDKAMDAPERTEMLELAKADEIPLTIKPKAMTVIRVEQVEKLEPIFTRADLAIAAREVSVEGTSIRGTVHNIGSSAVDDAIIAVVDGRGAVIAKQSLGRLDAPLDLVPRTVDFSIDLPRAPEQGWNLVLDPDHAVPEIYEGNNTVNLGSLPAVDYRKGWN